MAQPLSNAGHINERAGHEHAALRATETIGDGKEYFAYCFAERSDAEFVQMHLVASLSTHAILACGHG
jgi:hypothetical protein